MLESSPSIETASLYGGRAASSRIKSSATDHRTLCISTVWLRLLRCTDFPENLSGCDFASSDAVVKSLRQSRPQRHLGQAASALGAIYCCRDLFSGGTIPTFYSRAGYLADAIAAQRVQYSLQSNYRAFRISRRNLCRCGCCARIGSIFGNHWGCRFRRFRPENAALSEMVVSSVGIEIAYGLWALRTPWTG